MTRRFVVAPLADSACLPESPFASFIGRRRPVRIRSSGNGVQSMTLRGMCLAILLLLPFAALAQEAAACASTLKSFRGLLGDTSFSSRWTEVSMDDGKPLLVDIVERNGTLLLAFVKTGAGLWAEVSGVICRNGGDFEARIGREQIVLGPAAHWALGLALANGGVFTLRRRAPDQLQIETQGWSGRFAPMAAN
jgi:hypothetical protein